MNWGGGWRNSVAQRLFALQTENGAINHAGALTAPGSSSTGNQSASDYKD